ncbi:MULTISPECIES: MipA/OmpV family protein [Kordiimonas]|jgi:outer membrane scaffolding protein for murein synthesis (MipA/OmpV family)|uniref:MipA/OmpV family protein n=1 Tax=Kordiimonas TaxID=288021 RepID=UPI00257D694B|nr:MipA/OmpV family protein [Kordiimonas sp. UBA4487]
MAHDRHCRYGLIACLMMCASGAVFAQDGRLTSPGKPVYVESSEIEEDRKRDDWSGQLGLGYSLAPDFLGADHHGLEPAVLFRASWRDKIFIENNKIGSVLHTSRFLKAGVIGRWNLGRKDDLTLRQATGAEEVNDAFEVGLFAAGSLYKFFLTAELYQGLSSVHKGVNMELEGGYTFELNSRLKLTPILGAHWASKDFMQAFFGVEDGSGDFAPYRTGAGIYELYGEASAELRLDRNWLLKSSMRLTQLKNGAARSPIVRSDIGSRYQVTGYVGLVWLF